MKYYHILPLIIVVFLVSCSESKGSNQPGIGQSAPTMVSSELAQITDTPTSTSVPASSTPVVPTNTIEPFTFTPTATHTTTPTPEQIPPEVAKKPNIVNQALSEKKFLSTGINLITDSGLYFSRFTDYCSSNKTILDKNLKLSEFNIEIDSAAIPFDEIIRGTDKPNGNNICVNYYVPLVNWVPGLHPINWKFTLLKDLNSGSVKFPAGYNRTQSTYVLYLPEDDTDKEIQDWPKIIDEDFSKMRTYIWTGETDNVSQKSSTDIADGSLIINIENQKKSSGYNKDPIFASSAKNFLFAIDIMASIEKPDNYSCFGVNMKNIKSLDTFPAYRYQICNRKGKYSIVLAYMPNNIDWSLKFKKDLNDFDISVNNKLEVLKSKTKYDFYLNGELLTTQDLSNLDAVGIGVGLEADSGSVLKIKYDNMSVKMPTTEIQSPVPLE